ncbi:hypothetical protein WJX74_005946 [Apatococcus lobatus]|uniref:Auxin efflux carrier n=1 Tax=Apatococcus lobatus TaxID=904363 RepID=A0AAW1RQ58_9CHLO
MAPIFVGLLVGSALPVVKICLICCIGAVLAHQKILKPPTRQALSQLLFFVFMPCLVFSKLSAAVDVKNLSTWWPLPANVLMSIVLGLAVGYATSLLLHVPTYLRLHISCAIAFGNVGNLPLVMVGTLCRDPRLPFSQSIGAQCEAVGTAYIVFAFWIASIVQSCLVYNLFRMAPSQPAEANKGVPNLPQSPFAAASLQGTPKAGGAGNGLHHARDAAFNFGKEVARISQDQTAEWLRDKDTPTRQALLEKLNSLAFRVRRLQVSKPEVSGRADVEMQPVGHEKSSESGDESSPRHPDIAFDDGEFIVPMEGTISMPHPAETALQGSDSVQSNVSSGQEQQQLLSRGEASSGVHGNSRQAPGLMHFRGAFHRWRHRAQVLLAAVPWQHILNMPTCSAVLGLVVGCLTPVKDLLYSPQSPVMVVEEGIAMLAGAALPCMLLVLGAILCRGPGQSQLRVHEIVGVVVAKLIIMPLLGAMVILGARAIGAFTEPDPLFLFLMLLVQASPTAINIQTMATLCKSGEAEVSALLFWEYICSIFTIPAFTLLFLRLI